MPIANLFEADFERMLQDRLFHSELIPRDQLEATQPFLAAVNLTSERGTAAPKPSADAYSSMDLAANRRQRVDTPHGIFWISGNAILCECPQCQSPLTIRSWLRLANCWRCDASVQLTKSQIDAIEAVAQSQPTKTHQAVPAMQPRQPHRGIPTADDSLIRRPTIDVPLDPTLEEFNRLTQRGLATSILRRGFSAIPAWLLSLVLHLILILLLALFVFSSSSQPPTITLSTFVSPDNRLGGEIRIENPEHSLVDDLMMANDLEVDLEEAREVIEQARLDAEELTVDHSPLSALPDLDQVKRNVSTSRDRLMSFAARDPRVRSEVVRQEGGTSLTEAAVARGLRWLATVQNQDGSWSLGDYDKSFEPGNAGDVAGTSLALLPFLGAGQTHEFGIYRETVARGLGWLIRNQKSDGDLRINFPGQAGMYAHGQAAIVLCEAFAMTGDQQFRQPAQMAIQFIEDAQHGSGGWRYRPGQAGDTSMLGWQLMALQSARAGNLGLKIEDSTFKLADYFLDQATYRNRHRSGSMRNMPTGSLYTYRPREGMATAAMTAEAILCRMYLGWTKDDPRLIEAIRWLVEHHLPTEQDKNIYYWYYGTQVMHHFGGDVWDLWNRRMREILVAGQEKSGARTGSWSPRGYQWGAQGGRIYVTSLSICSLEVYYRHLPIFKQIELDDHSTVSHPSPVND